MNDDARDPYVGLHKLMRESADPPTPYYKIGKITSLDPFSVRAAGLDLDKDDLKIAMHLLPGVIEEPEDEDGVQVYLPKKRFTGQINLEKGECWVDRPAEIVQGAVPLAVDDEVLLIPSEDGQTYYIVDKLVGVSE